MPFKNAHKHIAKCLHILRICSWHFWKIFRRVFKNFHCVLKRCSTCTLQNVQHIWKNVHVYLKTIQPIYDKYHSTCRKSQQRISKIEIKQTKINRKEKKKIEY